MKKCFFSSVLRVCAVSATLSAAVSYAQNLAVLRNFRGDDGYYPMAAPTVSGGTLYGTTFSGGSTQGGTLYKINTDGTGYVLLKDFALTGPRSPRASLVLSGNTLYGTTQNGGVADHGTVFKLNTDGSGFTVLKQFAGSDGSKPISTLLLSGGTLYGTTAQGGTYDYGTVFKINTDGSGFAVLKHFALTEGMSPEGALVLSGGYLYGTTQGGGTGNGTVYKISTGGAGYARVWNFPFSGAGGHAPYGGLVLSGSTLYGTTSVGGLTDSGTIFKVNLDGTGYTVLNSFCYTNGATPYAGLTLSGNILYGTTSGGGGTYGLGTLFQIKTDGTGFAVMKSLGLSDGSSPYAGLAVAGTNFYGACYSGGTGLGGTLFSFNMGPPPISAPTITTQPQSRTNIAGTTATFQVVANPSTGLFYQWRQNGNNLQDGAQFSGANGSTLTIANAQPANAGNYSVVVTNSSGALTSSVAILVVNRPPVAGPDAFTVPLGLSLAIPESTLLANDSDPDGNAFGIASVPSASDGGAGVVRYQGKVTYYGAFSGTSDHFTYTLTNSRGLSAVGNVNITLTGSLPLTNQLSIQPLSNGDFRAIYLGVLTLRYALECTHDLNPPQVWEPLATNYSGARGYTFFTNTPPPGKNTYYRVRWAH